MTLLLYTLTASVAVGVPLLGRVAQRKIAAERRRAERAERGLAQVDDLAETQWCHHECFTGEKVRRIVKQSRTREVITR